MISQDLSNERPPGATETGGRSGALGWLDALAGEINGLAGHLPSPLRRVVPRATRWRLIALAAIVLLFVVWTGVAARSTASYGATVLVVEGQGGQTVGIPPPGEALDFGDLSPGLELTRDLTLTNDGGLHTYFAVIMRGDLRDFVSVSDAFFSLEPGETKTVGFTARIPKNAEPKRYSGDVYLVRLPWWRP